MKAGDWFTLQSGNDWGVDYLARDPFDRKPCIDQDTKTGETRPGVMKFARSGRRYRLEDGEILRVRLRDGSERDGAVNMLRRTRRVGDMGHHNDVSSEVPFVVFDDGTEAQLTKVEIKYDPERDPTAAELGAPSIWDALGGKG